jgi:hypothetical protein
MPETVYILCAVTSLGCAALLLRAYLKRKTRLLLWSSLCFAWLTINNVILFADLVIWPQLDLTLWRNLTALAGFLVMIYGLVWETRKEGRP